MTEGRDDRACMRGLLRLLMGLLALLTASCSSTDAPNQATGPDVEFPPYHAEPASSAQDSVAYRDLGVSCILPGGGWLVDSTKMGIWIMDGAGQSRRRLLSSGTNPCWSGDGSEIVFELGGQLVVTRTDSLNFRIITSGARDQFPDWSPVDSRIVFESTRQRPGGGRSIWVVNANGTGLTNFGTTHPGEWRMPAWSPDGSKIVHIRFPLSTTEIYVMDQDGTNPVRLTSNTVDDKYPQFSPDGTQIAFQRPNQAGIPQIWVMATDGSGQRRVTQEGGMEPAWSRDGQSLIYVRFDPYRNLATDGVLWRIDFESGTESQLLQRWPQGCP